MPNREPQVLKEGLFGVRLCVPKTMTDSEIIQWVNRYSDGTLHGSHIAEAGDPAIGDCDPRIQCEEHEDRIHLVVTQ